MVSGDDQARGFDDHGASLEQPLSVEESTTIFPQFFINESSSEIDKGTIEEFHLVLQPWGYFNETRNFHVMAIGTSHVSNFSAQQVERYIELVRPDSVVLELDISRIPYLTSLHGIGKLLWYSYEYKGSDLTNSLLNWVPCGTFSDNESNQNSQQQTTLWQSVKSIPRSTISFVRCKGNQLRRPTWKSFKSTCKTIAIFARDKCSKVAGFTQNKHSSRLRRICSTARSRRRQRGYLGFEIGAEMEAAIRASNKHNVQRLVLADRTNLQTYRRFIRLVDINERQIDLIQKEARINRELFQELQNNIETNKALNKSEITVAAMETIKTNRRRVLDRYLRRKSMEIPEIYQALLSQRDSLIAAAIWKELENGAERVVVVVGLCHVPGIRRSLLHYSWRKIAQGHSDFKLWINNVEEGDKRTCLRHEVYSIGCVQNNRF